MFSLEENEYNKTLIPAAWDGCKNKINNVI